MHPLMTKSELNPQVVRFRFSMVKSTVVQPGYYVSTLGVICRNEWKMDKVLPVQLRFRLGSVEYVNNLEYRK